MLDDIRLEKLVLYLLSAKLVICLAVAYFKVRMRAWKVFFFSALIAVLVYGAFAYRMMGDHPGNVMGLMLYFMIIGALGVLLGFAIMVWRGRRHR